ncbi:MAG TPA: sulfatase [Actinomycetota bacterium]|nr:sulfatase [Actinomycetota bacterium]
MRASLFPRGRIALALVFAFAVAVLPTSGHARREAHPARPNILLIVTDDQRSGMLDGMPKTKRLFADAGVTFTDAFATTPLCCPSRASIMTGRYPHNHGVRRNEDADQLAQGSTLQYYLQSSGYLTAMAGKYLNGWPEATTSPPYFDKWAAIDDSDYRRVYRNMTANVNGEVFHPDAYSTGFIEEKSVDFLRSFEGSDAKPWFLYVAPFAPHAPFVPERRYRDAGTPYFPGNAAVWEADRSDKPPWVRQRNVRLGGGRALARRQARTLYSVDDMVDRIFGALNRMDEARDTLAIFVSDNGYLWGEHGLASKRFPYTGAVKIPLIIRWPGHVLPDTKDDRIAANIDLAPTILYATGIEPDPDYPIDGRALFGPGSRDRLLIEYFGSKRGKVPSWASIRSAKDQFVEYYDENGSVIYREYYDLAADPYQLVNLYGDADPFNDPPFAFPATQLAQSRTCRGSACP